MYCFFFLLLVFFFFFLFVLCIYFFFFFSSRRRHTRWPRDWSSDVCSSDLRARQAPRTVAGLALIALAAISWGTSGSVMTVLAERAAASPLLVGVARLWVAAVLLLLAA